jgi:uncharacterized repeat protein (TIGR01451 family)
VSSFQILMKNSPIVSILILISIGCTLPKNPADSQSKMAQAVKIPKVVESDLTQNVVEAYPNHAPFPINYDEWTEKASVTIADINRDGSFELLVPTYEGKIYAWSASGMLLPNFPITTGSRIRGRLALGDLNHDGDLEIAAGLDSASLGVAPRISIWHPNGEPLTGWPQTTYCSQLNQYCTVASIVFADLDNDSNLEVIAATTNRDLTSYDPSRYVPNLYVWKSSGTLAPGSWPNEDDHNTAIIGQIAVGDLNGDTYPDIVTGRDYNRLFAFDRLGGNLNGWPHFVWYPYDANDWTDDQIEFARSSPALADLDNDGDLEYIVPGHRRKADGTIYFESELLIYTAAAARWNGWALPASGIDFVSNNTTKMIEAPSIGDLTGDKHPEIILATQDGYVRAYTAEKQLLWAYNFALGREIHAGEAVIGDVDGDGWNEVVFGTFAVNMVKTEQVGIYILDHNGIPKPGTPLWVSNSEGISSTPSLGDLDSDGLIEIAAATYNGWAYVWDAPAEALPGRLPWPMPRHDLQRTGRYINPQPEYAQSTITASDITPMSGETITFAIQLIQSGTPADEALQVTDILPADLTYVPGSLAATVGTTDDSQAPTLQWSGVLLDVSRGTITFSATVEIGASGKITNSVWFTATSIDQFSRSITMIVNGLDAYLPFLSH